MQQANKEAVRKINEAFSNHNTESFLSYCTDNVRWTVSGMFVKEGKETIRQFMTPAPGTPQEPPVISLTDMIAEGNKVASTGTMVMKKDNGEEGNYSFCDIYEFEGEKVKEMFSYVVELKEDQEQKS